MWPSQAQFSADSPSTSGGLFTVRPHLRPADRCTAMLRALSFSKERKTGKRAVQVPLNKSSVGV
eukprot:4721275-Amphidinium_carterae.1